MIKIECPNCEETFEISKIVTDDQSNRSKMSFIRIKKSATYCPLCKSELIFTGLFVSAAISIIYVLFVSFFIENNWLKLCLSMLSMAVGFILIKIFIKPHVKNI